MEGVGYTVVKQHENAFIKDQEAEFGVFNLFCVVLCYSITNTTYSYTHIKYKSVINIIKSSNDHAHW